MLFNSIAFALFLPIVFAGYWMMRRNYRAQNVWLLVASYVFYGGWDWRFLFLIAGCSLVNYLAALGISASQNRWARRALLTACCVVCLGALGVFTSLTMPSNEQGARRFTKELKAWLEENHLL